MDRVRVRVRVRVRIMVRVRGLLLFISPPKTHTRRPPAKLTHWWCHMEAGAAPG